MLKFVPDHLKTNNMCNHAVKNLHFTIRYVPCQCRTHKMCDKIVLKFFETL